MKARFRRSTSRKALKQSGYFNARKVGGKFIFNKYAPTDKRAVIPNSLKIERLGWAVGVFGQPNPECFSYLKNHGWIRIK